jgi:hypothetical protein
MSSNDNPFSDSTMDDTVHNLSMPHPPPLLRTREANGGDEMNFGQYPSYLPQNQVYNGGIVRPSTPTHTGNGFTANMVNMTPGGISYANDFVTPLHTPQGSPSKNHLPPGAYDLPNVFDKSMRLAPPSTATTAGATAQGSPVQKSGIPRLQQFSPSKADLNHGMMPSSPTRKGNKENTPPAIYTAAANQSGIPRAPQSPRKDLGNVPPLTPAQQSRQEPYRTREEKQTNYLTRALGPEELEKLGKPSVKRLANVTQLCTFIDGVLAETNESRLLGLLL